MARVALVRGGRSHGQGKVGANLLEKEVEGILALDEEWQRLLEHAGRLAWGEQVPLMVATTSATIRGRERGVFRRSRACFLCTTHRSAHLVASKTSIKWLTMSSSKALKPSS